MENGRTRRSGHDGPLGFEHGRSLEVRADQWADTDLALPEHLRPNRHVARIMRRSTTHRTTDHRADHPRRRDVHGQIERGIAGAPRLGDVEPQIRRFVPRAAWRIGPGRAGEHPADGRRAERCLVERPQHRGRRRDLVADGVPVLPEQIFERACCARPRSGGDPARGSAARAHASLSEWGLARSATRRSAPRRPSRRGRA